MYFHTEDFTNASLSSVNEKFLRTFIPNIAVLGIYLLFGILGNIIVIVVYLCKMESSYDNKFFIPCLATGDILACIINGISAIVLHIFHITFYNVFLCKLIWFSMTWSACGASLILVYIAFHRYMKICRPTSQWVLNHRKVTTVIILYIFAVIISSPLLYTSGVTTFNIVTMNQTNSTVYICERFDGKLRKGWSLDVVLAYSIIEAILVVTIATSLVLLYMKVGFMLFKHFKNMLRKKSAKVQENISNISNHNLAMEGTTPEASVESTSNAGLERSVTKSFNRGKTQRRIIKKKMTFHQKHNYTYIFIAISAVCIATYTPRLLLMILETFDENFWYRFHDNKPVLVLLNVLNRLYIVNNIANPILYGVFDKTFKTQLIKMFKCKK